MGNRLLVTTAAFALGLFLAGSAGAQVLKGSRLAYSGGIIVVAPGEGIRLNAVAINWGDVLGQASGAPTAPVCRATMTFLGGDGSALLPAVQKDLGPGHAVSRELPVDPASASSQSVRAASLFMCDGSVRPRDVQLTVEVFDALTGVVHAVLAGDEQQFVMLRPR